jgi:hypothetical protein
MEVGDFHDGIKRLYNEENASENVGSVCGTDLSRRGTCFPLSTSAACICLVVFNKC